MTLRESEKQLYSYSGYSMTMPPSESEAGGGTRAATKTVQTMLVDFGEPMIAGKTHSEILAMSRTQRHRWCKRITIEEKTEIMKIAKEEMLRKRKVFWSDSKNRRKHAERMTEVLKSPYIRSKISEKAKGRKHSEETKKRIGEGNKGKILSEETKRLISEAHMGKSRGSNSEEHNRRISEARKGKLMSEDTRRKIAETLRGKYVGEDNPNWRDGASFEPYCPKFNDELKESIRNRDNRTCVLCGKGEILNGRRLSVHHIDSDKMQGCRGRRWYLCALCISCNSRPDTIEKEFLIVTIAEGNRRSGL